MTKFTPSTKFLGIVGIISEPVGGTVAERKLLLTEAALDRGAIRIPAKGGDLYVKFGLAATVTAAGDATDDCVIVHGTIEDVVIPDGMLYVSVLSDAAEEFNVPIQVVR